MLNRLIFSPMGGGGSNEYEYQLYIGYIYNESPVIQIYLGFGTLGSNTFGSVSPGTYRQYNIDTIGASYINGNYEGIVGFNGTDVGTNLHLRVQTLEITLTKNINSNTGYITYRTQSDTDAQSLFQILDSFNSSTISVFLS